MERYKRSAFLLSKGELDDFKNQIHGESISSDGGES